MSLTAAVATVHLPNEIWDQIISDCELKDAWVSLRKVNRQLFQCVERHFEQNILPHTVVSKSFYRNHTYHATEFHMMPRPTSASNVRYPHQTTFRLVHHTSPRGRYSRELFIDGWNDDFRRGLTENPNKGLPWTVKLCGHVCRPYCLRVQFVEEEPGAGEARSISFDWTEMVSRFFHKKAYFPKTLMLTVMQWSEDADIEDSFRD